MSNSQACSSKSGIKRVSRGEHEFSAEDVTSAGRHETILHTPFICFQSKFITVHQGARSIDDFTAQKTCSALIKPGKSVLYLFFKQKKKLRSINSRKRIAPTKSRSLQVKTNLQRKRKMDPYNLHQMFTTTFCALL